MKKKYLVTGGAGFLGAALVRRLVEAGHPVRVFDDVSRGSIRRLKGLEGRYAFIRGDIRDARAVAEAARGVDSIVHMAFVNGTEFFYTKPESVLDVGVKGILNVIDAGLRHGIPELVVASSSEVYQTPPRVPTPESVPLVVPDPLNPRYSYGAGKIISEVLALNWGRRHFKRVLIFRPHNVYGPDMGWEHVLPQFALRMRRFAGVERGAGKARFPVQGTGRQTRSFIEIEDFTDGLLLVLKNGKHREIYNIGTQKEISIKDVAHAVADCFNVQIEIVARPDAAPGGAPRRCPDTAKLRAFGFRPRVRFEEGVSRLCEWYNRHAHLAPKKKGRG